MKGGEKRKRREGRGKQWEEERGRTHEDRERKSEGGYKEGRTRDRVRERQRPERNEHGPQGHEETDANDDRQTDRPPQRQRTRERRTASETRQQQCTTTAENAEDKEKQGTMRTREQSHCPCCVMGLTAIRGLRTSACRDSMVTGLPSPSLDTSKRRPSSHTTDLPAAEYGTPASVSQ